MTLSQSILTTLNYHDIFNYPLTLKEIHKFLIGNKANLKPIESFLENLLQSKLINQKSDYFYLKNRSSIVNLRKQREKYSKDKLQRAQFFASLLRSIPSLKLVAISGALAMNNSHKNDDIDLVLVASSGTLWTTRFISSLILHPFRRKPKSEKVSNKACLNMFFDESSLRIKDQNIYTAHEIAQLKLLWDRGGTYNKFIKANSWIKKYLPNWQASSEFIVKRSEESKPRTMIYELRTIENLLRNFQLNYMRTKITTEKIRKKQLFFHPSHTQDVVLKEYYARFKNLLD